MNRRRFFGLLAAAPLAAVLPRKFYTPWRRPDPSVRTYTFTSAGTYTLPPGVNPQVTYVIVSGTGSLWESGRGSA